MESLKQYRRILIKVGSYLLTGENGEVNQSWLAALATDISELHQSGNEIAIVSSGAIAHGRAMLKLGQGALTLEEKQAAAAAGQPLLVRAWQEALDTHTIPVGQILLTLDDTENRRRYLNARETVHTLWKHGGIPVINENDAIATEEIRYGDNDRLAARVAAMLGADCLVLLSDVDGLYNANPRLQKDAAHVPVIDQITPEIMAMAGESSTHVGSGGMITKLAAAKIATSAGCDMIICHGEAMRPLSALNQGARSSLFRATTSHIDARKRWIAGTIEPSGAITIDDGARTAIHTGKSLLPAGVTRAEGSFERGDIITIRNEAGDAIGSGISAYGYDEMIQIAGKQSGEIEAIIGYKGRDAVIHRDDMVLL